MKLIRYNFGLGANRFAGYDDRYDNLLGVGKEAKQKRQDRRQRHDNNKQRRQDKKDQKQVKRVQNNDKRRLKNDMLQAKIEEKKATTTALTNQAQQLPTPNAPAQDNTTLILAAVGVVAVLGVIGFVMSKKPAQAQTTQPQLQAA
jgi:CHASE3 domain sensor protein